MSSCFQVLLKYFLGKDGSALWKNMLMAKAIANVYHNWNSEYDFIAQIAHSIHLIVIVLSCCPLFDYFDL